MNFDHDFPAEPSSDHPALLKVSRRNWIKGIVAGSFVIGVAGIAGCGGGEANRRKALRPDLFVSIAPTGDISIVATRSEMGQGVRTALPMILADELEADWARVAVHQAPGDGVYGDQNTDASASVRKLYMPMRRAGAAMRTMLVRAGAAEMGVAESECFAKNGEVVHAPSGSALNFGQLAEAASRLPAPDEPQLKNPADFRYIGSSLPAVDLPDIVSGAAIYGIDIEIPGMLHAVVARPPVVGGKVTSVNTEDALATPGVTAAFVIEPPRGAPGFLPLGGVAVVGNSTWSVLQGRKKLDIDWQDGANATFDSANSAAALRDAAMTPGKVVREEGDALSLLADNTNAVEAVYQTPLVPHTPMEPPACTAMVDGDTCEVWAPVQSPQRTRNELANFLKIDPQNVVVNVTLLGGAFGRKAKPDFVLEAAFISRQVGSAVKVTWTREDDLQHDYYHADSAQYFRAQLGDDGMPIAWLQRTAFPPIGSTFTEGEEFASDSELRLGFVDNPYRIANLRCENSPGKTGVRIGWLRSVCNVFHSFGLNVFVDELAAAAGSDPLAYRLQLLGPPRQVVTSEIDRKSPYPFDTGRLTAVLRQVEKNSAWNQPIPEGRGRGIAVHRAFYTYVAMVIEASVTDDGSVRVHRTWCVVDCGRVVNPGNARAQVEGAILNGLSQTLYGAITVENGRVRESNFNQYRQLRISEVPDIDIAFIDSENVPTGIGEPGVPPVAPALCSAIFAATGKRIRRLPIGNQLAT